MVQGNKRLAARPSGGKKNKMAAVKQQKLKAKTKKGNPSIIGKNRVRHDVSGRKEDVALSKAIDKSSESKVASKLLQAGKTLNTIKESLQGGKDINKQKRRDQVKKKVGRTEQNYLAAKEKSELRDQ